MDEEDPAAEAAAEVASVRLLAVGPVQWAEGWTARTVQPVLRAVEAVVAAGWEDQDQDREDGAAEVEEDLDRRREEAEGAALVQDLVAQAPVPTAAATITACTAVTVDTAALVGTAVRLRLITFGTVVAVVVMAIQEIMLGIMAISAVVEEEEVHKWEEIRRLINRSRLIVAAAEVAEALAHPGPALHPDRIIHSRNNHSTSNRIDMAMAMVMVGMGLEMSAEAVALDLPRLNNPTRIIRALRHHSGKIRARIRHNSIEPQDQDHAAEQGAAAAAVVVWVRVVLYLLRQRGEHPTTSQEWAAAVLEPLDQVIMTPPTTSDREQDHHRHCLDRCNSTSSTNKAHPWHPRGQGPRKLSRSRHHLPAKRRVHQSRSIRQSHQRRRNRRNPRYRLGRPPRHPRSHRPSLWRRPALLLCERKWNFVTLHSSNLIGNLRLSVPSELFWRSFPSEWTPSARSTTDFMAKQTRLLRVLLLQSNNEEIDI